MKTSRTLERLLSVIIGLSALMPGLAAAADPTPGPGTVQFNQATGHFYEVVTGSWDEAEATGVAKGGHLVTIDDADEQAWLVATFGMSNPQTMSSGVSTVTAYWIGLNDRDNEGQFVWTSGTTLAETGFGASYASPPWAPLEPSNNTGGGSAEDLVGMNFRICDFAADYVGCTGYANANDPGLWNDYGDGDFLTYGIIEYPPPQWSVDSRSTFLRTDSTDVAQSPVVIDLADIGVGPGDLIRIVQKGDFRYTILDSASLDDAVSLIAVFSGSTTLLDTSNLSRVADAIDAGDDLETTTTLFEQLPSDIPQDFNLAPQAEVTVPAGATHLLVAVHDSFYSDNDDPDGDLGFDIVIVQKADLTQPAITPVVTGVLGNAGWYVSDVNLDWAVSDPESAISDTSGCDSMSFTTDIAATTYTCTATSLGGSGSVSVTIKRDATPPTAVATAGPKANQYGWRKTNVTVTFAGADALSGGVTCDSNVVLASDGRDQSASGRCYDAAGNISALTTVSGINIDKTQPNVRFEADIARRQINVYCSDALSGVDRCTATTTSTRRTVTATAIDFAGNRRQATYRAPW